MHTRLTTLLGLRYPVVLPGMTYIAVPPLVAAVSAAGGLGILASGGMSADACRAAIQEVRRLTDRPFGVGCSLALPGAAACAEVAVQERVPVLNVSMGKDERLISRVQAYGGKVFATISNQVHARSALDSGVDGLIVTGHEAAAHGGSVTSMVLIPAVRDMTDKPLIAAGGVADGRGLAAVLALGADAAAMGTRFACSQESPVHPDTKQMVLRKAAEDTVYSRNFDTYPCRVMRTPGGERYTRRRLSPPVAIWRALQAASELGTPWSGLLRDTLRQGPVAAIKVAYFGAATLAMRKAIDDADHQNGVQLIGQSQGLVHDVATVAELLQRIQAEAAGILQHLAAPG